MSSSDSWNAGVDLGEVRGELRGVRAALVERAAADVKMTATIAQVDKTLSVALEEIRGQVTSYDERITATEARCDALERGVPPPTKIAVTGPHGLTAPGLSPAKVFGVFSLVGTALAAIVAAFRAKFGA